MKTFLSFLIPGSHVQGSAGTAAGLCNRPAASGRRVEFDYLRAFVVVLVLFHHSALGYAISAFINIENPIATFSPVVNGQRWLGFDLLVAFNEMFMMPLLFFISGIFAWQSLARKGGRKFLGGRLKRLGIPFVIGVAFLTPLAYYPAQLQAGSITGAGSSYGDFWLGMIRSGFGTAGPLWFLWLLLAFNCLAVLLNRVAPLPGVVAGARAALILGRPAVFFGAMLGISIAVYLPVAMILGPSTWIGTGPFNAQASRILLYLAYFLAGAAIGAYGIDRSVFRSGGTLAGRWWGWLVLGLMSFTVFIAAIVISGFERTIVSETALVVSCGAIGLGVTGFFLRFANRRVGLFDSLGANSYGIYIVHYGFVTWLQYLLLGSALAPFVKGAVVFAGTLILSWGTVAAMRRIPSVARVI